MIIDKLIERIQLMRNPISVGLNTTLDHLPKEIYEKEIGLRWNTPRAASRAITEFNKIVIDVIYDIIPAVTINIAGYEKYGPCGLEAYMDTILNAKSKGLIVIGDIKRGDDYNASIHYSQAHIGRVNIGGVEQPIYDTDFITINSYFGSYSMEPFIEDCKKYDKGMFILAKTSEDIGDFQNLKIMDYTHSKWVPIYQEVCRRVNMLGQLGKYELSSIGIVVGNIQQPIQLRQLRDLYPNMFFLVSEYDGVVGNVLAAFRRTDKLGAIINSSEIIRAHQKDTYCGLGWEDSIRKATIEVRDSIRQGLEL